MCRVCSKVLPGVSSSVTWVCAKSSGGMKPVGSSGISISETTKNAAAGPSFHPLGPRARKDSALYLGFDSALPFTAQQVNLMFYVRTEEENGITHCDLDLGTMPPPATLIWEYWTGTVWQRFELDKDETRALTRSGHVLFPGPGAKVKKTTAGEVITPLYWIRARLSAPMVLVSTNRDEVLGDSDGRPEQRFVLANAPVVVRDREERVPTKNGLVTIRSVKVEID